MTGGRDPTIGEQNSTTSMGAREPEEGCPTNRDLNARERERDNDDDHPDAQSQDNTCHGHAPNAEFLPPTIFDFGLI